MPVNCLHPGSQLPGGCTGRGWGDNWRVLPGSTLGHFRLSRSLLCCLRWYELVKRRNEIAHDCLEQQDIKFNIQENPWYWNGIVFVLLHGRFRSYMKSRNFQRRIFPKNSTSICRIELTWTEIRPKHNEGVIWAQNKWYLWIQHPWEPLYRHFVSMTLNIFNFFIFWSYLPNEPLLGDNSQLVARRGW